VKTELRNIVGTSGRALNAIRAAGAVVRLAPEDFLALCQKEGADLLVVYAKSGFLRPYKYLSSYKGLHFYAKSKEELDLPPSVEIITAKRIWIPD